MLEDVGHVPELLLRDPERALASSIDGRRYSIRKAILQPCSALAAGSTGQAATRIS